MEHGFMLFIIRTAEGERVKQAFLACILVVKGSPASGSEVQLTSFFNRDEEHRSG